MPDQLDAGDVVTLELAVERTMDCCRRLEPIYAEIRRRAAGERPAAWLAKSEAELRSMAEAIAQEMRTVILKMAEDAAPPSRVN